MFELPHTLRFRLTGSFLAIFGFLQVALWIVVNLVVTVQLRDRFDADLHHRAAELAAAVETQAGRDPGAGMRERVLAAAKRFANEDVFFEIRSPDGGELATSSNMLGFSFPGSANPDAAVPAPRYQDLKGEIAEALCGKGCELRVVTLPIGDVAGGPLEVRMGSPVGGLHHTIRIIRQSLLISAIVSLVTAGVASWIVAARSLAPLEKIAARARSLTAERLDERLPAPSEGDEVAGMIAAINEMLTRFERQFKNQQRFISSVSHELRTPLAILMIEIQMQRRLMHRHPELVEFFSSAEEEVSRLLRMVESFLILTRAKIHQRLETVAEASVETVVVHAVQDANKIARTRDVRIVPQFPSAEGDSEPVVSGDADLLATAFHNLLSNAVRYSPQGQTVDVQVRVTPTHVEVKVRDRGPGIPEEHHPHIFDMFYQVATRSGGGTAGVGLAIVKTVVELHGGTVTVRNVEDGGCEFTVRLPVSVKPSAKVLQTASS